VKTQRTSTFSRMAQDLSRNAVSDTNPKAKPVLTDEVIEAQARKEAPMNAQAQTINKPGTSQPKVAAPKVAKPKPFCECGCGGQTGGGHFIPGHDAKLKSRLFSEARNGSTEAVAELHKRNWYYLMAAPKAAKDPKAINRTTAEKEDDSFFVQCLEAVEQGAVWMNVEMPEPAWTLKSTRRMKTA
jgi:hypothetical protein